MYDYYRTKLTKSYNNFNQQSLIHINTLNNYYSNLLNIDKERQFVGKQERISDTDEDEEPVLVKDVDRDLAGGLMAAAQGVEKAFGRGFGEMEPVPMLRFARGGEVDDDGGIMDKINKSMERDFQKAKL